MVIKALKRAIVKTLLKIIAWRAGTGRFTYNFHIEKNVKIPMKDGIKLSADIYIPIGKGPFPVVLTRLPYGKASCAVFAELFARYGYVLVIQDTRGKFDSEGEFYPFIHEKEDGKATTAWVKSQPWCNGKLGMFGISYFGYTQWALAPGNHDITSITPIVTTSNIYNLVYWGGSFGELSYLNWSLAECGRTSNADNVKNIDKAHRAMPLIAKDRTAYRDVPNYKDWVSHPTPDDYWAQLSVEDRIHEISAPMYLIAGWYDIFNTGQLKDFELIKKTGQPQVAAGTKILIGPWNHGFSDRITERIYGIKRSRLEIVPFKVLKDIKEWYDYSLKGITNNWEKKPPVKLYVLGENVWRYENEWPLTRTVYTGYYLHSGGSANTYAGDGRLDTDKPVSKEPADSFAYDPQNLVPTVGGSNLILENSGPMDQRKIEKREDILVYSTEPLQKEIEATGPVQLTVYVASDAADTDFTGKLADVFPDGKTLLICDGILRARYRNGLDRPELMENGKIYKLDIFLGNTSVLFKKGHKIHIEVSSSNFPRFDRNPNTGADIATETNLQTARQSVFHDADYPSCLILPVIPRTFSIVNTSQMQPPTSLPFLSPNQVNKK